MKNYFLLNEPHAEDGLYVCEFLVPAENPEIVFIENDFGKPLENESPQNEPPQNKPPQNGPPQNKPLENKPPPEDKLFVNEYCTFTETESSEILPVIEFLGPVENESTEIIHFGYNFEESLKNEPPQDSPPENLPVQNDPPQNDPVQNALPQNGLQQNAPPQNDPPRNNPPDGIYRCHFCGLEFLVREEYEVHVEFHLEMQRFMQFIDRRDERRDEQGNGA